MLELDRKELDGALRAVKATAGRRSGGIPALSGVLVEAGDGRAVLTTTDLETSTRAAIPSEWGAGAVPSPVRGVRRRGEVRTGR